MVVNTACKKSEAWSSELPPSAGARGTSVLPQRTSDACPDARLSLLMAPLSKHLPAASAASAASASAALSLPCGLQVKNQ